jgi:hypothetical protein
MCALAAVVAIAVASCGKAGGAPHTAALAGVYHLREAGQATSLELRTDGTFTVRRESCTSIGVLACGEWVAEPTRARMLARSDPYWPTPDDFPSSVVESVTLRDHDGDLVVTGESPWAGRFTQRWSPGRRCAVCRASSTTERPCSDPLPACAL